MVVSRVDVEGLGLELVRLYAELESSLASGLARQITAGIARPGWQTERLAAAGEVRRWAEKLIRRATGGLGKRTRAAVQRGYETGGSAAARELAGVARRRTELGRVAREIPGAGNIDRLAAALAGRLDATQPRIVRSVLDAYRQTVTAGAASVLGGADTRRDAAQRVWNRLLDHGLTGFTDARGRNWSLAGYVEMATRTTVAQAAVAGQLDRMAELGLNLCIVSDAPQECERCRPWEGKVLTRDSSGRGGTTITAENEAGEGTVRVRVAGSVDEAISAGLMHPNAILGDLAAGPLGEVENAVRAWYDGPSVHLTTARGNALTVSPNHPVLTARGWLRADDVREGDQVFSTLDRHRVDGASVADEALNDVPTTFQQVFDALAVVGYRQSGPAARDDFHGDGRSYKGEVHVVWAERALLAEVQAGRPQQFCERHLVRAYPELATLTGESPLDVALRRFGLSIARALPNLDAARDEPTLDRRAADAGTVSEILAGLSCEVAPDQVVHVKRDWYSGHAYDLQTTTGAYLAASIIVHNCRHSLGAYLPGLTKVPPAGSTADPEGDKARQRLRELERRARAARLQAAGALTPEAKAKAEQRLRDTQALIRQHVAANKALGIKRRPDREQLELGNVRQTA